MSDHAISEIVAGVIVVVLLLCLLKPWERDNI
jgi:hypothetical protein